MRNFALFVATGSLAALFACSDSGTGPSKKETPPVATTASASAGDGQTGTVGAVLPAPIAVKVLDQRGQPISGVTVAWSVIAGGGTVSVQTSATDGAGQASASWTLGTTAGENKATATAGTLTPVTFTATGSPGPASSIQVTPDSVTLQAGKTQQFTAEAKDQHGNIVTPALTWTSSDTAVAKVDAQGLTTVALARKATVTASVQGVSSTATVVVVPGPATTLKLHAGQAQTALAATAVDSIAVKVTDAYANGVPDVGIAWAVTAGGGSVNPASSTTDTSGVAKTQWTLGKHAGANDVTATSANLGGSPTAFSATATPNATISGTISVGSTLQGYSLARSLGRVRGDGRTSTKIPSLSRTAIAPSHVRQPQFTLGRERPAPPLLIVRYRPEALGLRSRTTAALARQSGEIAREIRSHLTGLADELAYDIQGVSPVILSARVDVGDLSRVEEVRNALQRDPKVLSVEKDQWAYAIEESTLASRPVLPSDPGYAWQAWHYGLADLPRAWSITTGSSNVIVAVVDDGIRFDHPSLSANLTSDGYDFVSQSQMSVCGVNMDNAGDGSGYDPDPTTPVEFNCSTGSPSVAGGHGLHVAGTIGAAGGDNRPFVGVNWTVKIRPVRVLGLGGGLHYDIAQGILYAAGLPADDGAGGTVSAPTRAPIINLSLGGYGTSAVKEAAVQAATQAGSLLIAAAGNDNTSDPMYPAAYPEALSVASVSPYLTSASYSNFGSTVDISAPGGETSNGYTHGVASTLWDFAANQPAYGFLQGTSMAAPHVSGIAALILASEPSLSATELRSRLTDYAIDLGTAGRDDEFGAGLVNARNSLTRSMAPRSELFVRLYDAVTGAITRASSAPGGKFELRELPDGEYYVFAGLDEENDQLIGIPGRRWGAFTSNGTISRVVVDGAGTYSASFSIGLPSEVEPNDETTSANLLPIGGYLHASFGTTGDIDFYRLTVPSGTYTFETSAWLNAACGFAHGADTVLDLFRGDGTPVGSNDDGPGLFNYCSILTANLEAGTYFIRVTGTGEAYRLRVRSGS